MPSNNIIVEPYSTATTMRASGLDSQVDVSKTISHRFDNVTHVDGNDNSNARGSFSLM